MVHELPKLKYGYDALEPYIDAKTMEIHYSKHHQGYTNKLNAAVEDTDYASWSAERLLKELDKLPEGIRTAVRNNGGGYWNHSFFWELLKKDVEPQGAILNAIKKEFGSFDNFKEKFSKAAMGRFGSGWAWLVVDNGKLKIISTANQDSAITLGLTPILALDVWEHAYYLKYQNKRNEYVENFFNVIDWKKVDELYNEAH